MRKEEGPQREKSCIFDPHGVEVPTRASEPDLDLHRWAGR